VIAFSQIVWRQGNVLGYINAQGGTGTSGHALSFAQLQQTRIAAVVPPADPGPPVVVKPVIGKPIAQPAQPKAGKRFSVVFRLTRSDDRSTLTNATAATTVRIAGRLVPHRYVLGAGRVRVTLVVPKTAKGKQLRITVKVRTEGQSATKSVAYKVR
jgi:hypothetical protein